jgi:hypothetical protein
MCFIWIMSYPASTHLMQTASSYKRAAFLKHDLQTKWVHNIRRVHKAVPLRSIEAHLGERRYSSYSFLTSALEGGEWSASPPGRALPPGKEPPVPTVQKAGWAPEPVWTQRLEEKSSASVGDRTPAVQSVVRHYTDWATSSIRRVHRVLTQNFIYIYIHIHISTCLPTIVSNNESINHSSNIGINLFCVYIIIYFYKLTLFRTSSLCIIQCFKIIPTKFNGVFYIAEQVKNVHTNTCQQTFPLRCTVR